MVEVTGTYIMLLGKHDGITQALSLAFGSII
jgi:hypothetical protein